MDLYREATLWPRVRGERGLVGDGDGADVEQSEAIIPGVPSTSLDVASSVWRHGQWGRWFAGLSARRVPRRSLASRTCAWRCGLPLYASSLIQLPMVRRMLRADQKVGLLVAVRMR